ncbi:hypothetical protein ARAM_001096 [Aspergillus rambellii]|uniref:Zn(2)-C6 fungal-type domain-containing protein n=1 Tax=Aspergillus rambellii TaxID=308745 RepID=A0A0F8ULV0_9EURO|nr:hypothetical protein ARAM_001096 [Aspergillus rambellii]
MTGLISANAPKCDENRPFCSNCTDRDIICKFSRLDTAPIEESPPSSNAASSQGKRYRFLSGKYQEGTLSPNSASSPTREQSQSCVTSVGTQCNFSPTPSSGEISFADLRLFHHFTTTAFQTIVDHEDVHDVWQYHVVQWSFSFPPIFHLILAFSALHLAHEQRELRGKYIGQADDHFTSGVQSVSAMLSQINVNTCQQVYISAILVCFVGSVESPVPLNGVKLILQLYGETISGNILKPKIRPPQHGITSLIQDELLEYATHMHTVQDLVKQETNDKSLIAVYMAVIQDLLMVATDIHEARSAQSPAVGFTQILMGWLFRLPERFMWLLGQKDQMALVIFAHWVLLLKYMRSVWFMVGWDTHVISGIRTFLHPTFEPWIQWPVSQIFNNE